MEKAIGLAEQIQKNFAPMSMRLHCHLDQKMSVFYLWPKIFIHPQPQILIAKIYYGHLKSNFEGPATMAIHYIKEDAEYLEELWQKNPKNEWICGDFSIADFFWMSNLQRIDQMGLIDLVFGDKPLMMAYWKRLQKDLVTIL
eukprot:UN33444